MKLLVLSAIAGCALSSDETATSDAELRAPPSGGYAWSRGTHERRDSVPIDSNGSWQVVYSVPVPHLDPSEHLSVRGEVQLTVCQQSDLDKKTPCLRVTPFDPKYKVKIVLGDAPNDGNGKDLSETHDIECTHLRHHCALAVPEAIAGGFNGSKYVNLVVSAVDSHAQNDDRMIVNQGDGAVYVTRIDGKAKLHGDATSGHVAEGGWMKLDMENAHPRRPHVTLQAKLHDLHHGDVIDVDAVIEAVTSGSGGKPAGCDGARDPLVTNEVFLSSHENDPLASKIAMISPKNGKNCGIGDTCSYRKSGSFQVAHDEPGDSWVSVVSYGGRSCSAPSDEWRLGGQSDLHVSVRAP
jgi:hypothetical protein